MRSGESLTDAARTPWLAAIHDAFAERLRAGTKVIVACSALTRAHRNALRSPDLDVRFLQLSIPQGTSLARLQARSGHFAGPGLAASQHASLQQLQPDEPGITIDGTMHLDQLIAAATAYVIHGMTPATDS
jgi:gluconokinase